MNTLSESTGVAYGSTWIPFHPRNMLHLCHKASRHLEKQYCREGKSNVLAAYTAAGHEYTLSEHTAVADGVDWLYLDTLSPVEDAVPWTTRLFDIWKTMNGSHNSGHFCWIKP